MPDPTPLTGQPLNLQLPPDVQRSLADEIDRQRRLTGSYNLTEGQRFDVDLSRGGDGGTMGQLKAQLGRYIDFDAGGLKLVTIDMRGNPGRFVLKPGWSGGPKVTLEFRLKF